MPHVHDLLNELREQWIAQGVPVQDLAPGASAAQLEAAEKSLGFPLANEVRDWFTWSNGYVDAASASAPNGRSWFRWPNMFHGISLEDAVREHHESRASHAKATAESAGTLSWDFGAHWINLTSPSQYCVVADCSSATTDPQAPSALHYLDIMEPEEWHRVAVPSVTELLEIWLQLTQNRAIWFGPEHPEWDYRYDAASHGFAWAEVVLPFADPELPRI